MSTETQEVTEVKKKVNKSRLDIQEEKGKVDKLGEETKPVAPKDMDVMYAGKLCAIMIQNQVRAGNLTKALLRAYKDIDPQVEKTMLDLQKEFIADFEKTKKRVTKIVESHPLWAKFAGISGFSAYQLGLIMAYIKDIGRFDTPSKLMVYSGIGTIDGMAITKGNIAKIKEYYFKQGKEFKGFHTEFSGRMFVVVECLIRAKGWFYDYYSRIRVRLHEKAINTNMCEPDENGKLYMKGKKKQSLILYTDKNAKRRVARTLLHFIYTEWRKLEGLEARNPYAIDYLGHTDYIQLEEVLKGEAYFKEKKADERAKKKAEKAAKGE